MKNKGKFLLIPAAILLLGGCSPTAKTNIPRGYSIVDPTDANARNAFFAKVSNDIAITYEKGSDGFKVKGAFGFDEVSYTDGQDYVKIMDAEMDFVIAVDGFAQGAKSAEAMVEISDLGFKFEAFNSSKNKKQTLKVSGVDATAYYTDNKIYLDLSDKDLKNATYGIIDLALDGNVNAEANVRNAKEQADRFLTKILIEDNYVVDDVEDVFPSSNYKISSKDIADLTKVMSGAFEEILKNDSLKNLVTLSEDKDSNGAAIRVALASEPVKIDGANVSGNAAALLSFDKDGVMDNIGLAGNARIADAKGKEVIEVKKANLAVSFEYGSNLVKLPSFNGYSPLN